MLCQDLSVWMKTGRVLWVTVRFCIALACLYFFVCSLDVLQRSFQLLSGQCTVIGTARIVRGNSTLLPVCCCGPGEQEISIDCCSNSVRRANAGSATLSVYTGS